MAKRVTNKDIMKRLDELEKSTEIISASFLFYSIAIAFLLYSFVSKDTLYIALGLVCYIVGILSSVFRKHFNW